MFVLLVQPPTSNAGDGGLPWPEPAAPPWDLVCLHAYLRSRTGHRVELFDARLHDDWAHALENQLPRDSRDTVLVVRARLDEWPAACAVFKVSTQLAPDALRVLAGPAASACPAAAASRAGASAVMAGDPEPILRALLENRHTPGRLRLIPGLALPGQDTKPFWWPDLGQLPVPAWDSLPWNQYTRRAAGGVRALVRISRGHPGEAADRATGGAGEPLRVWNLDRLAASFGKCAHLGVVENVMVDPPGLWTVDRLRAWCEALQSARNTHPWSLRMLPRKLSPAEAFALRQAGCRRVEFILPSARPGELAHYGIRGDAQALSMALRELTACGLEVLLRCWVGGPGAGAAHREARSWRWLAWRLQHPPMRFQVFPLALDAPLLQTEKPPPDTPTLAAWLEHDQPADVTIPAWGGKTGLAHAQATAQTLNRGMESGWMAAWQKFWTVWPTLRVIEDLELRSGRA